LKGLSGLVASQYATGLQHAASFAFDGQGRLWIATAAYEDTGDDAVYVVPSAGAKPLKVITGLHTPLGLLWQDGELYVSSHERVDAYSNFDGSAFTASRIVVSFPSGVGENNGLARSPEGRIVLGISAPCDACTPASPYSAAIVSFMPDGSDVRVDASGIRAPIGLAYYPGTSDLFVTMNQRDDLGDATPGDWLAIVRSGENWGFPSCYGQDEAACADVPSPLASLDEHAAVSGVAIVTGQLGTDVGNAAVVAEWATGKVMRVSLARHGSSYTAKVEPLLVGVKNPVAVALGPDRALYVGDWSSGTIYRVST
jgi:glucose/arabinose dehydrogenase